MLILVTWAGSIISSRGVTLIKEVRLKVVSESVVEEAQTIKKQQTEDASKK